MTTCCSNAVTGTTSLVFPVLSENCTLMDAIGHGLVAGTGGQNFA